MIRVLIVNEQHLIASLFASVLDDETDIVVVGRVINATAALKEAGKADVLLVSTGLPDNGALDLVCRLVEDYPDKIVLVVGVAESQWEILKYIEAGASGYILKDDTVEELLDHIRAAYDGKARVSPQIAAALIERVAELAQLVQPALLDADPAGLTPRAIEVLKLIDEGLSNQEIGERLTIELGTVKNHVHNILDKLNVTSRRDAAAYLALIADQGSA
jgi:two-component system, NarL family, nitrate/nitrite response regulator NarL